MSDLTENGEKAPACALAPQPSLQSGNQSNSQPSPSSSSGTSSGASPSPAEAKTLGDRIIQSVADKKWTLKDLETATGIKAETWFKLIRGQGFMSPVIAKGLVDAFGPKAEIWKDLPISINESANQPHTPRPDPSCSICHGSGEIIFIRERRRVAAVCPKCHRRTMAALGASDAAEKKPEATDAPGATCADAEEAPGLARLSSAIETTKATLDYRLGALRRLTDIRDAELESTKPRCDSLHAKLKSFQSLLAAASTSIRELIEDRSVLLQQAHQSDEAILENSARREAIEKDIAEIEERLVAVEKEQEKAATCHTRPIEKAARKAEQSRIRLDNLKSRKSRRARRADGQ